MTFKYDTRNRRAPKTIIELVRRKKFKMTQIEFAEALNKGQSTIARWEHVIDDYRTNPKAKDIVAIRDLSVKLNARVADKELFSIAAGELVK